MKEKVLIRWIVGACLLTSMAWALDRPEPNAFLNRRADSVSQLITEIKTDPAVADRYARHFGKTRDEMVQLVSQLHVAKLNATGTYMIYSVDDEGIIKARPQRLKAGTRVFADANGVPVLKASCGNAMVAGTNAQGAFLSPAMANVSDQLREIAVTTPVGVEEGAAPMAAAVPQTPLALTPATPPQVTTGSRNQGLALPALLAGIGGAGAFLIGGHGGGTPVPEPASMVVIGGALAAMACRRRKR
jgi:hypothetical protein